MEVSQHRLKLNMISTIKHKEIFDPSKLQGEITIIGLGALGTAVALMLAKIGCRNLILVDDDVIEHHNLSNQVLYGPDDVGKQKTPTASRAIYNLTGIHPVVLIGRVTPDNVGILNQSRYVFVCVDSMQSRKDIFNAIRYKPSVSYFNDGRMGSTYGTILGFENTLHNCKEYETTLYSDEEVVHDVGACGVILNIGTTAMTIACQQVQHFINHVNDKTSWNELSIDVEKCDTHLKCLF